MHIGEKIRMVRRLRSYTQEVLGTKINKTRATISFIEQTGQVNHFTLKSILKVLNISEDELMNIDQKTHLLLEPSNKTDYQKLEIESLKSKILTMMKELEGCKALIKSQKKHIALLEKSQRGKN